MLGMREATPERIAFTKYCNNCLAPGGDVGGEVEPAVVVVVVVVTMPATPVNNSPNIPTLLSLVIIPGDKLRQFNQLLK